MQVFMNRGEQLHHAQEIQEGGFSECLKGGHKTDTRETKKTVPPWLYVAPMIIALALMNSHAKLHGAVDGAIFGGIVGGTFALISYGIWRLWIWLKPEPAKKPEQLNIEDAIRQARLETESGQSDATTLQLRDGAPHQLTPQSAKKPNFVLRHWRGELSLPVSYWINLALLGFIFNLLIQDFEKLIKHMELGPVASGLSNIAFIATCFSFVMWQLVGTWRSAGNYLKVGKTPFWGGVARVVVILNAVALAYLSYAYYAQIRPASFNLAMGKEDTPDYELRILNGGKAVGLSGGMPFGTADALTAILDAGPDINMVHLNSDGGWITEGKKIARMIRSRKLSTYTSTECSSACTMAFLGGTLRYLSPEGRLGFHSASFGNLDATKAPELNSEMLGMLRERGVPEWFIEKVARTSSTNMWYPTHKELLSAGIVTRVLDANQFAQSGWGAKRVDDPRFDASQLKHLDTAGLKRTDWWVDDPLEGQKLPTQAGGDWWSNAPLAEASPRVSQSTTAPAQPSAFVGFSAMFEKFLPPTFLAGLIAAFSIARFETQRWVRTRIGGTRGSSEPAGFVVDATFGIASTFGLVFLIALLWDYGWQATVTLITVSFAASMSWSFLMRDNLLMWIVSTIACWPLMLSLGRQVSWFGLMG